MGVINEKVAHAHPVRVNVTLFDTIFAKSSANLSEAFRQGSNRNGTTNFRTYILKRDGPNPAFRDRVPIGPINGIIRNQFILCGNQESIRNKIGLVDRVKDTIRFLSNLDLF